MRPGVKAQDIARKQNEIIGAAGYEKYCGPPYMRTRGHNFGLGQIDLTDDNTLELQPNMVMVVHPNQFLPETGYLACGETILVTETGIERLNQTPTKLFEA
jgi:Xaa-Pro aminopeptidase